MKLPSGLYFLSIEIHHGNGRMTAGDCLRQVPEGVEWNDIRYDTALGILAVSRAGHPFDETSLIHVVALSRIGDLEP